MNATHDPSGEFTGKYTDANPIARILVDGFFNSVFTLIRALPPTCNDFLEIGCGAGYSTQRIQRVLPEGARFQASELQPGLAGMAAKRNPELEITCESAYELARTSESVDCVLMLEVLEHLEHPDCAIDEVARVTRRYAIVSTPREPLWRAMNMARGKYLRDWGNTPGHLQHWSSRGLMQALSPRFNVLESRTPVPWTIFLLEKKR